MTQRRAVTWIERACWFVEAAEASRSPAYADLLRAAADALMTESAVERILVNRYGPDFGRRIHAMALHQDDRRMDTMARQAWLSARQELRLP
jgi:hypothetical protein